MLVGIKPKFCSESQPRSKSSCQSRSNRFLNPELVSFCPCSRLFELKLMPLLDMHCIAYALGTLGILTCIRMKTPYSYPISLFGDVDVP
jgi:hypothetical protein